MEAHATGKGLGKRRCVQECTPEAISVPAGLPAFASIKCSKDAYAVLSLMCRLGLMAAGPLFAEGPYEVAVRRLAGEFEQQRPQQLPSQQRRRKPKKKR